jgi:outer membrane protein OmpA-like peptidoglycan-associated protein
LHLKNLRDSRSSKDFTEGGLMVVNDNLLTVSQTFFSPDIVQKISDMIGQTSEKTRTALKSVIPTLMSGIVDIGSTPDGAAKLVNMINTHNFETINRPDENLIREGHDVVQNIFGTNLTSTVQKLEAITGLGVHNIVKMMDVAAPVFMGVLGSKVKYEKTGSLGIMHFLSDQKTAMSGFTSHVSSATDHAHEKFKSLTLPKQEIPWRTILLVALFLLIGYFWWMAANRVPVPPIATTETGTTVARIMRAAPIRELDKFLAEGTNADVPKHFQFERLRFVSGEVGIARGSEPELDRIAMAMKANPAAEIRIEGFTDNVGPEVRNIKLSLTRAQHVKDQIVLRGVDASRILAYGYGPLNPVANNAMVHGRAANNRVELVVTRL